MITREALESLELHTPIVEALGDGSDLTVVKHKHHWRVYVRRPGVFTAKARHEAFSVSGTLLCVRRLRKRFA